MIGTPESADAYERRKRRSRARQAAQAAVGQEISPLPPVADPARKAACGRSLRLFCETYLAAVFNLPWAADHVGLIARMEDIIWHGGLYVRAMPRGGGKTAIIKAACLWADLYGFRRYSVMIAAAAKPAKKLITSTKKHLETNPLLLADFPETVYPIRRLARITNRQKGQKYNDEHTYIEWLDLKIVLPTVAGSPASGSVIEVMSLDSSELRGPLHTTVAGEEIRPDFAFIDDPQTRESAGSLKQTEDREELIFGDILGQAGPAGRFAAVAAVTVIYPGDLAERMLDRDKHPDWQGERSSMMPAFPANAALWDHYTVLRGDGLRAGDKGAAATAFYAERRATCGLALDAPRPCAACERGKKCMDAGAVISWAARTEGRLSAVQLAMDIHIDRPDAFRSEYQNEPQTKMEEGSVRLDGGALAERWSGFPRRVVPRAAQFVTASIDVHDHLLFWMVAAWEPDFTGYVIDYGTHPDQRRRHFTLREAPYTLGRRYQGVGREAAMLQGVEELLAELSPREWPREDGSTVHINRLFIDTGHEQDIVLAAIRRSGRGGLVWPLKGVGIGPAQRPFAEYKRKPGDMIGDPPYWRVPSVRGTRQVRSIHVDTNYWKSFLAARLQSPIGSRGTVTLFGSKGEDHRLLAEHCTAEYGEPTQGLNRAVTVWLPVAGRDNHWWDCMLYCTEAASTLGVRLAGTQERRRAPARRRRGTREATYL